MRELSSESETEGVSFVEWYNVKSFEFRRGDENRPQRCGSRAVRCMVQPIPAPSMRELSSESETEGVSSDGSTRPMVTRKPLLALEFLPVTFIRVHSLCDSLRAAYGGCSLA